MEENYLKELVKRYLEKKSTDEELEIFVHLMKQGKLDRYIREAMDTDIDMTEQDELHDQPQKKNKYLRLRWPIAATIALALSLFAYISVRKHKPAAYAKTYIIRINNSSNTIYKKILPDRSTVWLNPNTFLSYPSKFGKFRKVKMQGEAFFEVTKDHAHPFIVFSGRVQTKVWGTSFRIRSIAGETETKVSVLTGKVSVSIPVKTNVFKPKKDTGAAEVLLLPHEEVTYQPTAHRLLKTVIPATSDMVIWYKANLSFENATLAHITGELSKYYHVQVQAEGKQLNQYQLTADFTGKNLADILLLICKSVHANYTRQGSKIILRINNQQPIIQN